MAFETFSLAEVLQNAELINQTRSRSNLDRLRGASLKAGTELTQARTASTEVNTSLAERKFTLTEGFENARFLFGSTKAILDSDDPVSAAAAFFPEAKRRGIILSAEFDASKFNIDDIRQINEKARVALGGLFGFTDLPASMQELFAFQRMSAQGKQEFLNLKRQFQIKKIGGVEHVVTSSGVIPLSTIEQEVDAESALAGAQAGGKVTGAFEATEGLGLPTSPAQIAIDKEFGKEFVTFTQGGFSDAQKGLVQLQGALDQIQSGKNLTGPVIGSTPDFILKVSNPEAIAVRENIEEVVQRNLRIILGAQFTEKEGERLIARAFNPNLDEEVNAQRLGRLMVQMQFALDAKVDQVEYFEQNGTLAGWGGRISSIEDFILAVDEKLKTAPTARAIEHLQQNPHLLPQFIEKYGEGAVPQGINR